MFLAITISILSTFVVYTILIYIFLHRRINKVLEQDKKFYDTCISLFELNKQEEKFEDEVEDETSAL